MKTYCLHQVATPRTTGALREDMSVHLPEGLRLALSVTFLSAFIGLEQRPVPYALIVLHSVTYLKTNQGQIYYRCGRCSGT